MFGYLLVGLVCLKSTLAADWDWSTPSPLDTYVNRPDPSYAWHLITSYRVDAGDADGIDDTTVYVLNMTSQTWKDTETSSRPVWYHHLTVSIPDEVEEWNHAFLWIGGGRNREPDNPPDPDSDIFVMGTASFAYETRACAAYIKQIPNQPVFLPRSNNILPVSEDAIIGWTWRDFIESNGSDPEILLRMPMTKAVVRAFDTMAEFARSQNPQFNLTKFMPSGASKRGWTTWTTAAVDRRVFAMAPIVLSVLKLQEVTNYHYRAYGGWSFAFGDYYRENVTQYINDPRTKMLADIVDPYSYRSRLTMPKVVIQATGDEFFRPDEPNFWFNDLVGEKFMMIMENTHHGLTFAELDLFDNLVSFFKTVTKNYQLPRFNWTIAQADGTGTIDVYTPFEVPTNVRAWFGLSADGLYGEQRRDFRWAVASVDEPGEVDINPVVWDEDPAAVEELEDDRHWRATFDEPATGWLGFFVEVVFENVDGDRMEFTTELNVVPNTWPFQFCTTPEVCKGNIV